MKFSQPSMQDVKDLTNDYSRASTIHGFAHFGVYGVSRIARFFWTIAFISCCVMLFFNTSSLLQRFLRLELETRTEASIEFGVRPFPAVTICSQNGYSREVALKNPAFRELLAAAQAASGHIDIERLRIIAAEKFNLTTDMEGILFQRTLSQHLQYLIRELTENEKIAMTYKYEDIVKNCAFSTETCTRSDFVTIYNVLMGNCYTYNNNFRSVKKVYRGGPNYGLKLFVYSNLSDYIGLETSNGALVLVHDQNEYPFPDTFGYFIPPSTAASLTIRATRHHRLNMGFSKCSDEVPDDYIFPGFIYTVEACRRSCFQVRAQKECGCVHPAYRKSTKGGMRYCTFNETEKKACLDRLDATDFECDCPNRCTERTFDVDISTSSWRSESGRSLCHTQNDCDELLHNGMLVTVYFEDLNERLLTETPAYPLINLMSDTAGQFGFWIGLSFIGVIEFLLFLISVSRIIYTQLVRFYRQMRAPILPPPQIIPEHDAPPIFYFGDPILPKRQLRWMNAVPSHVEERMKRHKLSAKSLDNLSKL